MKEITDLVNELILGDYGKELTDYSGNTYICDAISEIADNNTSIYYCDIKEFIINNFDEIENAINEFGWDGCGSDLYKAGQLAEYSTIQNDLYSNLDDSIKYYALNYLMHDKNIEEIDEELEKIIDDLDCEIDNNNTFSDITDLIDEYLENKEEMEG